MILKLETELAVKETADGAKMTTPEEVNARIEDMRDLAQECFCVLTVNTKNKLIQRHLVSLGTVNSSLVHAREVFRTAIKDGASSIIVAHNHPSGDPSPSSQDIQVTKKLIEAGKCIGIDVLDHLIIGEGPALSLREAGLVAF